MKKKYLYLIILFILGLTACNSKLGNNEQAEDSQEKTESVDNNQKSQKSQQDQKYTAKSTKDDKTEPVATNNTENSPKDSVFKDSIQNESSNDTANVINKTLNDQNNYILPKSSENNTVISFLNNLNWIDYSLAIIIIALVVVICYFCIKLFGCNNELLHLEHRIHQFERKVEIIQKQFNQAEQVKSNSAMSSVESADVRNLRNNLFSLTQKVVAIENFISGKAGSQNSNDVSNKGGNATSQNKEIILLGRPSRDREFDDSTRKLSASEDTYYTFYLDSRNPNKATFDFTPFDITRMYKAIDNRTSTIEFACDVIDYISNPSKCIAIGSGSAHLDNGKWIIDKKAQVNYV